MEKFLKAVQEGLEGWARRALKASFLALKKMLLVNSAAELTGLFVGRCLNVEVIEIIRLGKILKKKGCPWLSVKR